MTKLLYECIVQKFFYGGYHSVLSMLKYMAIMAVFYILSDKVIKADLAKPMQTFGLSGVGDDFSGLFRKRFHGLSGEDLHDAGQAWTWEKAHKD